MISSLDFWVDTCNLFESLLMVTQDDKLSKYLFHLFFTSYVLQSLRLLKLKTEGKTIILK